jgi:hypothetical protein
MNERTIQLYKQAVDFAYTTAGEDAGKGTVVEGLTAGKFAELIVQECIDEIKHLRMNYDTHQDVEPEENDWYIDAFLQAEVRLKEHFGVE